MKRKTLYFALTLMAFTACVKEVPFGHEKGKAIVFGAATSFDNGPATRTEYSGELIGTSPAFERINWVVNIDQIRILCEEVSNTEKTADYLVTEATNAMGAVKSSANIGSADDNALRWGDASETHHFFAFYPASSMGGTAAGASITPASGHKATVTGTIPATQPVTWDAAKRKYKPDMNYAYMYAVAEVDPSSDNDVYLPFKPLMTAFELKLEAVEGDLLTTKLTSVTLSSTTSKMSGNFTATLSASGLEAVNPSNTGTSVSVSLGEGVLLEVGNPVTVTLFALPVKQENLTLSLGFANGATRKLELKEGGSFVDVAATKKMYVERMGVPGSIYYLEVSGPGTIDQFGNFDYYTVKSFRDQSGTDEPVGWTAEYSVNGTTWTSTRPGWLFDFTDSDATGSIAGKEYLMKVEPNIGSHSKSWTGATSVSGNTSKSAAIDLSLRNVQGQTISQSTANCYVVSKPGWYKIPCVYGNAIKNGGTNSIAYSNSNSDQYALRGFVNHRGTAISNPWIKNNGITLSSAKLLWQDVWYMVKNVQYENDYVYFYIDPAKIFQGNALVAVFDNNGLIAWSWHIWVTDKPGDMGTKDMTYPLLGTSVFDQHCKIAMVNLGWCDPDNIGAAAARSVKVRIRQNGPGKTATFTITQAASSAVNSMGYGPFYQWGRKDAMLPSYGIKADHPYADHPQWSDPDLWGTAGVNDRLFKKVGPTQVSLAGSIENPNIFYFSDFTDNIEYNVAHNINNWCSTRYDNLWDANGKDYTNNNVVKTIYDPCPFGFKLPNRDVFNGMSKTGWTTSIRSQFRVSDNYHKGWDFIVNDNNETVFMPGTGLRITGWAVGPNGVGSGNTNSVGDKGDYWLATTKTSVNEVDFLFDANNLFIHNGTGTRSWGFPVRAIADL